MFVCLCVCVCVCVRVRVCVPICVGVHMVCMTSVRIMLLADDGMLRNLELYSDIEWPLEVLIHTLIPEQSRHDFTQVLVCVLQRRHSPPAPRIPQGDCPASGTVAWKCSRPSSDGWEAYHSV